MLKKKEKKLKEKRKIKFSIKKKLLFTLLPIEILILSVILILVYSNTSEIILRKSENLLSTSIESVVYRVGMWMKETVTALEQQRDALEYFPMSLEQELDYIKHTVNQSSAYPDGIYIGTKQGELIHASFVPDSNYNIFEKPWYKEGINSEKFLFGSAYLDENSKSYVIGASGMLKDKKGEVRGVAAADIYLSPISDIVKEITLEQTGQIFIVDTKTNMIIGHKDPAFLGTNLNENKDDIYQHILDLVNKKTENLQIYEDTNKNKFYIDLINIPDSEWMAAAYVPYKEIIQDLNILSRDISIITIIGILLLILCIERMIHISIKPIKTLTKTLTAITNGDFSKEVNVHTKDEIGLMAVHLNDFIKTMRKMMSQIIEIAKKLNIQSNNNSEVADDLSKSANLQADSMNEMNITMDELAHSISEVAESASFLSDLVAKVGEHGEETKEQMKRTVDASKKGRKEAKEVEHAMLDIVDKVTVLESSVQQVGSSITQINTMVELIHNIADETNLLSLNASIEAARAGEGGKGFAVVANEIRKLAATSKEAVGNISDLTNKIGVLVEDTIQKTKESSDLIKNNTKIVNEAEITFSDIFDTITITNKVITEIISKIQQVSDIASNVASITQEQTAASEEILATVENLSHNAKSVLENSNVVAKSSEELGITSEKLEENMKRFQLK